MGDVGSEEAVAESQAEEGVEMEREAEAEGDAITRGQCSLRITL
jgi:hypothetical protein